MKTMINVRATTPVLADKLFVRPWAPTQEAISEHLKKKSDDPAYAETEECKNVEAALLARSRVIEAFQASGKENEQAARQAAIDVLPQVAKEELAELGAELPIDNVILHLDLGDLLMCAYYSQVVLPTAPVAKARVQMRLQRLAAETQKDEFEIDAEALACIDKVISADKTWEDLSVETYVMVGEKKSVRICRAQIVGMFPEIIQALVKVFAE